MQQRGAEATFGLKGGGRGRTIGAVAAVAAAAQVVHHLVDVEEAAVLDVAAVGCPGAQVAVAAAAVRGEGKPAATAKVVVVIFVEFRVKVSITA